MKVTVEKPAPRITIECSAEELRYMCHVIGRTSRTDDKNAGFDDSPLPMDVYRRLAEALASVR